MCISVHQWKQPQLQQQQQLSALAVEMGALTSQNIEA